MSNYDEEYDDDTAISGDFYSIVNAAQLNELEEVERAREREKAARDQLAEAQRSSAMTLMQIAGLRSAKEIEAMMKDKDTREIAKSEEEEQKRKDAERERLVNKFPPPILKHS